MIPSKHSFVKALARTLRGRCGVVSDEVVLLAVSGGADSTALLRASGFLSEQRGRSLRFEVAHVQHHLRDADGAGDRDADFVATLARDAGLPCHREDLDGEVLLTGNTESAARRQRYDRLERVAVRIGARHVAVAHHGDDQLETILMRLLRGSSVRGLRAMPWRRPIRQGSTVSLVRPLLGVGRAQVRVFLEDIGQTWCEDATNADQTRVRNRLRQEVLPVLHDLAPGIDQKSVRFADHCRQVTAYLDRLAASAAVGADRGDGRVSLSRAEARRMPVIVLTTVLRRLLLDAGARPDRLGHRVLRPIVRAIRDGAGHCRVFQLSSAVRVFVEQTHVRVVQERT